VNNERTYLGFGLGLRAQHYEEILSSKPSIDWFEIITENYLIPGGKPLNYLDRIRADYPIVMHGVSLSIGSTDPLDWQYLKDVKTLAARIEPKWISDHLCWTGIHGRNLHDLMPLPYTAEAVQHVSERIRQVQDFLGRQLLIENVSSYLTYQASDLSEWEFLSEVCLKADCLLLLDINNIVVSSRNHGFNPLTYLENIPADRVYQHHLAGHTDRGDCLIDTHDAPIIESVWELYAAAVRLFGPVSTMIERDDNIPPLNVLLKELEQARKISQQVLEEMELAV